MIISKKNLIAAGMLMACAAPMLAHAQSNVQIYGRLYPAINNWSLSGGTSATQPVGERSSLSPAPVGASTISGVAMDSSNSKIGFRGSEDLGNDLKAIFQLEIQLELSDGSMGNVLFSQDSFVGLDGKWGTLKFGRLDTVYKNLGDKLSYFGISSGNFVSGSNILSRRAFGTGNNHRFHERLPNTIYYESPDFGPVSAEVSYAMGEVPGDVSAGSVFSAGLKYVQGGLNLALMHEVHIDYFGASRNLPSSLSNTIGGTGSARTGTPTPGASSYDMATRVTAGYRFPTNTRVEVNYAVTKLEETGGTAGRFASHQHNSWAVNVQQKLTPAITVQASYGEAEEGKCSRVGGTACSTAGLDSQMVNAGAYYALSKRTGLFALYSQMRNGASATRTSLNSDLGRPTPGQTTKQFALGIDHSF